MTIDELCLALELGPTAQPVIDRVMAIYSEVDEAVAERASGHELPCHAGCEACCHEAVFICAPEWLVVADELLRGWPLEQRRAVHGEMLELAERFEDELELLETITPGAERDEVAARIRFRCPLLTASGRCSIYTVRELNGRTFGLTWNSKRNAPYGCELTHERLRVLPEVGPSLFDATDARKRLADAFPKIDFVHVYPWWFRRFGEYLLRA